MVEARKALCARVGRKEEGWGQEKPHATRIWGEHVGVRPVRVRPGMNDEDMDCVKKQDN
jgi:hypothetical protein